MRSKEISKFLSGFAANQVLTHAVFAVTGVQFTLLGIAYTPQFNTIAAVIWLIVLFMLAYYAWIKK